MIIEGRTLVLGDDVSTDDIIAGKHLRTSDVSIWRRHAFETLDPAISAKLGDRPLIVAGANFGCGSSREQAVIAIKLCGVRAIVAKSFGLIFYRNCVNNGLFPLLCNGVDVLGLQDGESLRVDLDRGEAVASGGAVALERTGEIEHRILSAGGLLAYFKLHGRLK